MTDTMIERVARAMFEQAYADATGGGKPSPTDPEYLEYASMARAAIEAMRVPSEALLAAGERAAWDPANNMPAIRAISAACAASTNPDTRAKHGA